jgi:hypothetical protein
MKRCSGQMNIAGIALAASHFRLLETIGRLDLSNLPLKRPTVKILRHGNI